MTSRAEAMTGHPGMLRRMLQALAAVLTLSGVAWSWGVGYSDNDLTVNARPGDLVLYDVFEAQYAVWEDSHPDFLLHATLDNYPDTPDLFSFAMEHAPSGATLNAGAYEVPLPFGSRRRIPIRVRVPDDWSISYPRPDLIGCTLMLSDAQEAAGGGTISFRGSIATTFRVTRDRTHELEVREGVTAICIPLVPDVPIRASGLLSRIADAGGQPQSISRFDSGRIVTRSAGGFGPDFDLVPGIGYSIACGASSVISLTGEPLAAADWSSGGGGDARGLVGLRVSTGRAYTENFQRSTITVLTRPVTECTAGIDWDAVAFASAWSDGQWRTHVPGRTAAFRVRSGDAVFLWSP